MSFWVTGRHSARSCASCSRITTLLSRLTQPPKPARSVDEAINYIHQKGQRPDYPTASDPDDPDLPVTIYISKSSGYSNDQDPSEWKRINDESIANDEKTQATPTLLWSSGL